jgi:hypothetical protein
MWGYWTLTPAGLYYAAEFGDDDAPPRVRLLAPGGAVRCAKWPR